MPLQRIEFAFRPDGTLRGRAVRDWPADGKSTGSARALTPEDIEAIGSLFPAAYEARVQELEAEIEALRTEHAAELQALREELAGSTDGDLGARLAELFRALPMEVQMAFSGEVVTIMRLLDLGRSDLARARLEDLAVEENLAATKAAMLEAITGE